MAKPKNSEQPVFTSMGLHKVKNNEWCVLTITSQGTEIIGVQATEPNLKSIAVEELKIKIMTEMIDQSAE